jgi:hypothetical protein
MDPKIVLDAMAGDDQNERKSIYIRRKPGQLKNKL